MLDRSAPPGDPLPVRFFEAKAFYDGLPHMGDSKNYQSFAGGIIPHHLVAGSLIGDMFARLALQKPETIILIGPNHYEVGDALVISSRQDWKNEFGTVTADRRILDDLYKKDLVSFNDSVMVEEHSTQGMMPYVSYFTPESKVAPLILSAKISKEELNALAQALSTYVREGAVVIAPVDFSHHLTDAKASLRDKVTIEVIEDKNIDWLLKLRSEHLDSAASIALLIMLMERTGHDKFTLINHTNSGHILGDPTAEVTSYLEAVFR